MNKFILNIMIVYCVASIVYILGLFIKPTNMKDFLTEEQLEEYNKIKKRRSMIFIIGIVVGLCIIIMIEPNSLTNNFNKLNINTKQMIEDVSDISVI
jgi:hypothetical protein